MLFDDRVSDRAAIRRRCDNIRKFIYLTLFCYSSPKPIIYRTKIKTSCYFIITLDVTGLTINRDINIKIVINLHIRHLINLNDQCGKSLVNHYEFRTAITQVCSIKSVNFERRQTMRWWKDVTMYTKWVSSVHSLIRTDCKRVYEHLLVYVWWEPMKTNLIERNLYFVVY